MSITTVCENCGHKTELDAVAIEDLRASLQMCQPPRRKPVMPFELMICLDCEIGIPTLAYPEWKLMPPECTRLILVTIEKFRKIENYKMILWTCSDVPINYVGELIGNGTLKASEVSVKYCLRTYRYDEKGYLIDWPYGVFSWRLIPLFEDTPIYKCPVCGYTLQRDLQGQEIPCCPNSVCNSRLVLMDHKKGAKS